MCKPFPLGGRAYTRLFFLSLCRHEEAIHAYKKVKAYNPAKALENLGRCYANMDLRKEAVAAFKELIRGWPKPHYFIPFGRCLQSWKQYDQAIQIFQKDPDWPNNTKLLMAIGCCLEAAGNPDKAIEIFQKVRNWEGNNPAILSYGRCLEKKEEWKKAEDVFKMVDDWETNQTALSCLARTTQRRLDQEETLAESHKEVTFYLEKMPNWRENTQALLALIHLYLRAELFFRAAIEIGKALKRFPEVIDFYRLKGYYFSLTGILDEGIPFIQEATTKFPQDSKLALRLLEFYLKSEDQEESVKLLKAQYSKQFARDEYFMQEMHQLIRQFGKQDSITQRARHTFVKLPDMITALFNKIGNKKVYLVGSTVVNLLLGEWTSKDGCDIDFATHDKQLEDSLKKAGFTAIDLVPGLYRKHAQDDSTEIDVMLSSLQLDESEPWINHDVAERDFTICALFCDDTGRVIDPTGHGLNDVREKRLATVVPPALCFQHDPICIFRGLKYIIRGFIPTDEVEDAIRAWNPPPHTIARCIPHLAAVIKKLIRTNRNFVDLLGTYGLTNKLKALFCDPQYRHIVALLDRRPVQFTEYVFKPK